MDTDDSLENDVSDSFLLTAGYAAAPDRQLVMTRRIVNIVGEIPNARGVDVFYWDAI